jgi:hypothetical protein
MKIFLKISVTLTIVGAFGIACQSETSRKVQNMESFARLYGYARWFHPSDEAQAIDWDKFAMLGVQKVENVKSTAELRDTLYRLFSPIVQGLQIYEARKPEIFNPESLLSPDPNAKPVAWQHYGVYLNDPSNLYKSIRTNKSEADKIIGSTTIAKNLIGSSYLNGKEVKFSGYFRSNKRGAKLFIQPIVSPGNKKTYEVLIESQDWKRHELTLTIPQETKGIIYGFEIDGDVEIWADDFAFVVNNGGEWILADTANMGFECGKTEDDVKPINSWTTSAMFHTVEVTDENTYSGKYCLKVSFTGKTFGRMPQFGEITKASIGNNLICVVPLTLLSNDTLTYPKTDLSTLIRLQSELANISADRYGFNQQANLASVIIAWNVLQHFFPYFDVIDTDWDEVLGETLENTLGNTRKKDFFMTLSRMFAKIDDGHGVVYGEQMYNLPIRTEYIENKIVITASNDTTLKRGDIIRKMDGKSIMEALDEKEKIISGSPQLRRYRALNILGGKLDPDKAMNKYTFNNQGSKSDPYGTHLVIERDGKEQNVTVANSRRGSLFFNPVDERKYDSETIVEIESGIYYINMANCTENEFEQKKDALAHAKAVIYDQRGGSRLNFFQIIPYLIEKPVTSAWWNIPRTIYPDRQNVEFYKSNWDIQPRQPLFKSKAIIINVPPVVSAGETMMSIIDHYNLATTVGEPTAGCNGNINTIKMPCGYYAWFTGMKVLKHDGSQLYLKGFEPDYPVKRTIRAIREGRDEYVEKALEVAKHKY